jgi:hypothetical protein
MYYFYQTFLYVSMNLSKTIAAISVTWVALCSLAQAVDYGKFVGNVETRWLDDGRQMELLSDFEYIDPRGKHWLAPKGSIIDGASIPQFFWSSEYVGGPYEGKYRKASAIHDVACAQRNEPWEAVHKVFEEAMLASGEDKTRVLLMAAAVYHFGPRWPQRKSVSITAPAQVGDTYAAAEARTQAKAESAPGSEIRILRSSRRGGAFPFQTSTFDVEYEVVPPPPLTKQEDFNSLKAAIESGKISSFEDIQKFRPQD